MAISQVFNMDCMEGMKQYPDGFFDLAVVDPPYGISVTARHRATEAGVPLVGGEARPFGGAKNRNPNSKANLTGGGGAHSFTETSNLQSEVLIQAPAKSLACSQRFTMRSMTAPHRTQSISGSYGV